MSIDSPHGSAPRAHAATVEVVPEQNPDSLLVDIVVCDASDPSEVVDAARALRTEARRFQSLGAWAEAFGGDQVSPDLAVVVGRASCVVEAGVLRSIGQSAPNAGLVAALTEPTFDQAAAAVRHGAGRLVSLPASAETVLKGVRDYFDLIRRGLPVRRESETHRRRLRTLTTAEADVLDALMAGMANKQIAQKLMVGLRTVELRRAKIMRKMEASSVAQLVRSVCLARRGEMERHADSGVARRA